MTSFYSPRCTRTPQPVPAFEDFIDCLCDECLEGLEAFLSGGTLTMPLPGCALPPAE